MPGATYLQREVRVELVVVENVPDHLVEHGEERTKGPEASVVHDVVQAVGVLKTARH